MIRGSSDSLQFLVCDACFIDGWFVCLDDWSPSDPYFYVHLIQPFECRIFKTDKLGEALRFVICFNFDGLSDVNVGDKRGKKFFGRGR